MARAIKAVEDNECGYQKASSLYNVPKTTLVRRVKGINKLSKGASKMMGNKKSVLPQDLEEKLAEHILKMEESLFGLTYLDVRRLGYELAEKNGFKHNFNNDKKMAGHYWLYGFLRRHPQISLRAPENTSAARSRSFNKTNVDSFFTLYQSLMDKYKFPPNRVYNCDEKGITTVPNHPPKILARTGKKQVGTMASGEKGTNTTVMLCGSADGNMVPPMFIFPRVKDNPDLLRGAPVGTIQANNQSGWMTKDSFIVWLKHFIDFIGCSQSRIALLILDGHSTHTKSIEAITIARENGLHVICLPPHCTHRLQPLDVTCMKPLSTAFARESQLWLRENGRSITIHHIAELFAKAYTKSFTPQVLLSGFEKCGLWPIRAEIFEGTYTSAHQTSCRVEDAIDDQVFMTSNSPSGVSAIDLNSSVQSNRTLPEDIIPVPVVEYKKKGKSKRNRQGAAAIVTSSPYMKQLTLEEENKQLKEQAKDYRRELKVLKKQLKLEVNDEPIGKIKTFKSKRKLFSSKESEVPIKKNKTKKKKKNVNQVLNVGDQLEYVKSPSKSSSLTYDDVPAGQFILVKFTDTDVSSTTEPTSSKDIKPVYYAGHVMKHAPNSGVVTKFLRRADLKKRGQLKFTYPDDEDICKHHLEKIVLLLPKPKLPVGGRSKRLESIFEFGDDRMNEFNPIM